ncbi:thioredoxin family protein [Salibacterium halotolerans]|uniref:Thioredoxin n=1 Tax=Salibacterium halotolerans TaxID=1884432 RepID=A0A1I5LH96_9BACI|nr:thioredoxin family protein [Salibacterium halotolerans]SFO96196.1 Thioredoxin [Salibacterium halotolerans]
MISSENIQDKLGTGITPEAFMEKMKDDYRRQLDEWHGLFTWNEHGAAALEPLQHRNDLRCAILAGDWCPDVHRNFGPALEVMKQAGIPVEVFIMEQHDNLMEHFQTMGGRSVPKVILTNSGGDVLFSWGPRPAYIQEPMASYKRSSFAPGDPEAEVAKKAAYKGVQARYGSGSNYQKLVVYELTNQLLQL